MRTLLFSGTQIKLTLLSTRGEIRLRLLQHIKIRDVTWYLIKTSERVMNKQTAVTPYTEETNKEKACKQQQQQMHVVYRYSVSCCAAKQYVGVWLPLFFGAYVYRIGISHVVRTPHFVSVFTFFSMWNLIECSFSCCSWMSECIWNTKLLQSLKMHTHIRDRYGC